MSLIDLYVEVSDLEGDGLCIDDGMEENCVPNAIVPFQQDLNTSGGQNTLLLFLSIKRKGIGGPRLVCLLSL